MTARSSLSQVYTDEGTLLRKVTEWLAPQQRDGIKTLRICDRYQKGYADIFICAKGWFVCAELKDDKGKTSPHQDQFLAAMRAAGAVCGVCRSVEDVKKLVEEGIRRAEQCET